MSLRRRIAAAAALAVAAVAITVGIAGYLSTRSHLIGQVRSELRARVAAQGHHLGDGDHRGGRGQGPGAPGQFGGGASGGPGGDGGGPPGFPQPNQPPIGEAAGYFQVVDASGKAYGQFGTAAQLPVDPRAKRLAQTGSGSFFTEATVHGVHEEVLTAADPVNHVAVEVGLALTSVDAVLHGLLPTYGVLVGAGILLAAIVGTIIGRAALAPIRRFTEQTEQVTSALDRPRRLEESGAEELRRLAVSFNQTLDALERSIQSQRQLIADASHELRTPMAALRSNIQIFLEADRLPEEDRAELQTAIMAELDELTQLVSDVLELARGAAPGEQVEALELDAIVLESVARAQRRAPQMRFALDIEPTVIVNAPERVARAVTNVVDNARKWSAEDGVVEVSLRGGVLVVRDHGPGFRDEDLPHVFDRFYRADQARRMPGSGLGLAIVKQAAEARGGFARAANAPGAGARLEVSFGQAAVARGDSAVAGGDGPARAYLAG